MKDMMAEVENFAVDTKEKAEELRLKYLSKKGVLNEIFAEFKKVKPEEKREYGQKINSLKTLVESKIAAAQEAFEDQMSKPNDIDITLPGPNYNLGSHHPITMVKNEIIEIFSRLGFTVAEGQEIEDDYHNFTALNFAPEHPARDMQDTFFIETNPDILLRTHTSGGQVRVMEKQKPPVRVLVPGRVFRNEAVSARSHCIFHQIEGLYIDKNVSFADLKQTLMYFAKEFYGEKTEIRLRPSYFPFTEPSAEMDVSCSICGGKGCGICKNSGWLEVLGCGMVHPNVLKNCGIDPNEYSGFAFGMGIERTAMLRYGVTDIRMFFENDMKFLSRFKY
ncbi:MAG: phenylalanine--tRNA ligase subunit alpha [Bacteroidales bacterium]|nr:phenylalanine--tRNA ligase subunit alpha [Bacteroidales bacterium]MBQ5539536.1 phenylalanine--tRNA ligase subunit alpha [Bacteroidales bacterium]MBR4677348.1 phenylalanine--tRNA ligase subunit alpha [Bacteroidales bacterium]